MLSFANPAALLALLGLLVPLAIHLWNRRPGRVVPVGALRWLTAGANRRMRRLHLTQWPLLLLRLVLVAVLALLLAAPRWQLPPRPGRTQVLVSPEALGTPAWPLLRPTVDSLRRRGAELRAFAPGFPLLPDSLAAKPARPAARVASSDNPFWLWPLAAAAADSFPGQPLHLFTPASLTHFGGSRPALPPRLSWQLLPADSAARPRLLAAARPTSDSLWLTVMRGDAAGSSEPRYRLAWPAQLPAQLRVPGLPAVRLVRRGAAVLAASGQDTVRVQRPLRVAVAYEASRTEDLRYLRAALRVAAPLLPAGLHLRVQPTATLRHDSLDWLLWLADAPLPAPVRQALPAGLQVLRDAPAPGLPTASRFTPEWPGATAVQLLRRGGQLAPAAAAVWLDAAGQPVLTRRRHAAGAEYQLHTRLHPRWSSLPDDGQLPSLLLALLAPPLPAAPDPRALDPAQLRTPSGYTGAARPLRAPLLDLRPWAALLAGLLFALERLLASRRLTRSAA